MFKQTFKNIDNVLFKDASVGGEVVAVAHVYQRGTGWYTQYPEKFKSD